MMTTSKFISFIIILSNLEYLNSLQCASTRSCSCTTIQSTYEYQCPPNDNPKIVTMITQTPPKSEIDIQCLNVTEWEMDALPSVDAGTIEYFKFRMCPWPIRGFKDIMGRFGVNTTESLRFDYSINLENNVLKPEYFEDMGDLKVLNLDDNNLQSIDKDVFKGLGKLVEIYLNANKIQPASDLFIYTPNLEWVDMAQNEITYFPENLFANLGQLTNLHLWKNNVTTLDSNIFNDLVNLHTLDLGFNHLASLPDKVFEHLQNLKELNLRSNNLSNLPDNLLSKNVLLEIVRLSSNPLVFSKESRLFSNLTKLTSVYLNGCKLSSIPPNLFYGSNSIKIIHLQDNGLENLPENLFDGLKELETLDLSSNRIRLLPEEVFASQENLKRLLLENNNLEMISGNVFSQLFKLHELNLQKNQIKTLHLQALQRNPSLAIINLAYNQLTFEEYHDNPYYQISPFNINTELEEIYLNNNFITNFFEDWVINKVSLKMLDVSYNNLTYISFTQMQKVSQHRVTINLRYNMIEKVDLELAEFAVRAQDDLDAYSSNADYKSVVYLAGNPIQCDCNAYDLVRYFEGSMDPRVPTLIQLIPEDLTCTAPSDYVGFPVEELRSCMLTCTMDQIVPDYSICPDNCTCSLRSCDKSYIVDCSYKNFTSAPEIILPEEILYNQTEVHLEGSCLTSFSQQMGYENVSKLFLSDNSISEVLWLPPKIEVLHLHNNNMSSFNNDLLSELESSTTLMEMSLHNNSWICDCAAANLSMFLRNRFREVDSSDIICKETGKLLVNLTKKDLCYNNTVLIIVGSISFALICLACAILVILYHRYHHEIKVWLFYHEFCLWCVSERELDRDKTYDAFISYSHKDEDFVVNELLQVLESPPNSYKLNVHLRDWIPGQYIASQIVDSIQNSRRTLVVLSPAFLESVWGKMEFRTAHTQAMSEGRARVIVVVYGDVDLNEEFDDELKAYLKTNTYVKWGDPWFWEKLKYALPHLPKQTPKKVSRKSQKNNNIMISLNDKLDLIHPPMTPNPGTTPPAIITLDPLLLKSNPLKLAPQQDAKQTPPAEAGLTPLLVTNHH